MQEQFLFDLKRTFPTHCIEVTHSVSQRLFVHETPAISENGRPFMKPAMSGTEPSERNFKIANDGQIRVAHICIDGEFITYGQEKYDYQSDAFKDGRPDSTVFSESTFTFLELKLDQQDISFGNEDSQWKKFFEGVAQITDFISFLRSNDMDPKNYFPTIKGIVCMRFEPKMKSNSQRNQELLKRSLKLGFPVEPHNHLGLFKIS